jgi:hypothetical protein
MRDATEALGKEEAIALYERFVKARQAIIISEIRNACGIKPTSEAVEDTGEPDDDVAADVKDGTAPLLEPLEELEFELANASPS